MIIIDLDNPNKYECEFLFKTDGYSEQFQVHNEFFCAMAKFNEDGSVEVSNGRLDLDGDQIYDHIAFAAGVIAESEAYWYEAPSVQDVDEECAEYQGHLSNRELDGRFEGNW